MAWLLSNPYTHALAGPAAVLDGLGLAPGMRVLDAGCGPGRLTLPAAERVGSEGEVIALDVQASMLERVLDAAAARGLTNVRTLRGSIAAVDLGPTAVLRQGRLRVIVTSRKEAAVDPAFFALHGVDWGGVRLLANKAKNHFRAAFAGRCAAILECDTPGPAALDLAGLPFRHVPAEWRQG